MAETVVVQRGHAATHNMHLYPNETPTGMWASIEAQNAGLVAGNFQNHLICTRDDWRIYTSSLVAGWEQINQWRMRWPRLGSYSRLSFSAQGAGGYDVYYVLRLWDAAYTGVFYAATTTVAQPSGVWRPVVFEWSMDDAELSSHVNTALFVELLTRRLYLPWDLYTKRFCLVTASCPL